MDCAILTSSSFSLLFEKGNIKSAEISVINFLPILIRRFNILIRTCNHLHISIRFSCPRAGVVPDFVLAFQRLFAIVASCDLPSFTLLIPLPVFLRPTIVLLCECLTCLSFKLPSINRVEAETTNLAVWYNRPTYTRNYCKLRRLLCSYVRQTECELHRYTQNSCKRNAPT